MTTIRVKKDARYFSASNEPFNDKRLSWEARGLMGYLLSKPNDWEVRMSDLDQQGPAGTRKLRRMLAELRQYGYMNRIRTKLDNGKFEWTTEVYESPSQNPNPTKGIVKTSGAFCTSAISTSAKPPDILSTESQSTELNGVPPIPLSLENQIYAGVDIADPGDNTLAQRVDAANIIAMGFGINTKAAFDIALAFQTERGITFTASDIKGQRKAIKSLLEKKVKPVHVTEAVKKLQSSHMTVVDLFGVIKTAVDIASQPAPEPVR
jgi:hypothetical protein